MVDDTTTVDERDDLPLPEEREERPEFIPAAPPGAAPPQPAMRMPEGNPAPDVVGGPAIPGAQPVAQTPTLPPISEPTKHRSGISTLWADASNIHNPLARVLAKVGTGILGGAEGVAEGAFPRLAMAIPGGILNTELRNRGEEEDANFAQRRQLENAQANEAEARTNAYNNPKEDKVSKVIADASGKHYLIMESGQIVPTSVVGETKEPVRKFEQLSGPNGESARGYEENGKLLLESGAPAPTGYQISQKPAGEKNPIAGMSGGKQVYAYPAQGGGGFTDAGTGKPLTDFRPAPTYAMVAPGIQGQNRETKTVDVIGKDGFAHQMGWNNQTQDYDRDMGISGAGTQGSRMFAAGVSINAGEALIADLQKYHDELGTLGDWVANKGLNTPIARDLDPTGHLAQMQAELASFAALQPAQHGFRSTSALETFEKLVGGIQKSPEETIATIRAINKTAGAVNPIAGKNAAGGNTPPPGAKVRVYNSATGKLE